MEYLTINEIEKLHEQYSLNINKLINDFKDDPEKYRIFTSVDKNLIQTILVSDGQKELLVMELSKTFVTVKDKISGFEYRLINDESRLSTESIKECEVYEIYGKNKDLLVELAIYYLEDGKMECQVIDGEISFTDNGVEDIINAKFSKNFFFEEPDDEKNLEDEEADNYAEHLKANEEFILQTFDDNELNDVDDEEEFDDEDLDDGEELQDYEEEETILEFEFYKNDKEYQISSNEFDNVVQNIKEITETIASDFQIRVEEIMQLRNGINNILKLYKGYQANTDEQ